MKTVVGLFDDLTDARDAVDDLVAAGFMRNDISLIASDRDSTYASQMNRDTTVTDADVDLAAEQGAEGALAGALTGGAVGGLAGVLLGLGAFAIPGIGPIIAAGPIVAGLTGAGIGAAVGGLMGALVSWGIPEEEAGYYAEGIRRGGTLVGVKTDESRVDEAVMILNDHNPVDVTERSEFWRESGWTGYDANAPAYTGDEIAAERGRYGSIGADYDSTLTDSSMSYDSFSSYSPAFRQHYDTTFGTSGRDYTWYEPGYLYGYTLATDPRYSSYNDWNTLETEARRGWESSTNAGRGAWEDFKDSVRHAWEEVKDVFDDDNEQMWDDTTRRDYASERMSGSTIGSDTAYSDMARTGTSMGRYGDGGNGGNGDTTDYRSHFNTTYGTTGYDYSRYEPAYRFGNDLASDQYYREYSWYDIEPEVRRHWSESNEGTWEEFKEAVRHGWERAKDAVR
jgi:hypothetical protein